MKRSAKPFAVASVRQSARHFGLSMMHGHIAVIDVICAPVIRGATVPAMPPESAPVTRGLRYLAYIAAVGASS